MAEEKMIISSPTHKDKIPIPNHAKTLNTMTGAKTCL